LTRDDSIQQFQDHGLHVVTAGDPALGRAPAHTGQVEVDALEGLIDVCEDRLHAAFEHIGITTPAVQHNDGGTSSKNFIMDVAIPN
jgi:hypothetical protein